ncbi:hypothetical protein QWA68_001321 [Fusarium oxysporum]|nr:hypothetical protein QWA68_001321 [Fusarium oxysporum]
MAAPLSNRPRLTPMTAEQSGRMLSTDDAVTSCADCFPLFDTLRRCSALGAGYWLLRLAWARFKFLVFLCLVTT